MPYRDNAWLLTSISDQASADKQIPELLKCRHLSPVLGLSCEPLLGPMDIVPYIGGRSYQCKCGFHRTELELVFAGGENWSCATCGERCKIGHTVDWVIVGGESGPGARPCVLEHLVDIIRQCRMATVPVFHKQLGAFPVTTNISLYDFEGELRMTVD